MLMPRRSRKNQDLAGTNLQVENGRLRYRNPVTGKKPYMPPEMSREEAIRWALKANKLLPQLKERYKKDHIPDLLDGFVSDYLPIKNHSQRYLSEIMIRVKKVKREFEGKQLSNISRKDLNESFEPMTLHARKLYRALWIEVYKYAISEGLADVNEAQMTLHIQPPKRQRERLTMGVYEATREAVPAWFKAVMDLALYSLQRRSDLVKIKYEDYADGVLTIHQSKADNHLKVYVMDEIDKAIRGTRDSVMSPFMVHRSQGSRYAKNKEHWTQVSPEMLSREFRKHCPTSATFHEIRSLGARRYEEMGISKAYIQALLGHADERMTDVYLDDDKVKWTVVKL